MENPPSEKVFAQWTLGRDQIIFPALLTTAVAFFLFVFTLWAFYIVSSSTNIVLLLVPILLGFLFLATLPELFKSLRNLPEEARVYITDQGVYSGKGERRENYKFIPWGQMNSYDVHYLGSSGFLGRFFVRQTQIILKSKYEEDNFLVEAIGEDVDILRAYLKENNVPFGFVK
jgi:hypothetical protein